MFLSHAAEAHAAHDFRERRAFYRARFPRDNYRRPLFRLLRCLHRCRFTRRQHTARRFFTMGYRKQLLAHWHSGHRQSLTSTPADISISFLRFIFVAITADIAEGCQRRFALQHSPIAFSRCARRTCPNFASLSSPLNTVA